MIRRLLLILFGGIIASIILRCMDAHAEDPRTCVFYAREYVRLDLATTADVDMLTSTPEALMKMAERQYARCLVLDENLPLPGTRIDASLSMWAQHTARFAQWQRAQDLKHIGTQPATAKDDWRETCATEYRSWDPESETVVRYKSRGKRVPCPYAPGGEFNK